MARFWIGTSGWNYGHWRDHFYPEDLASSRWLTFYAQRFPTVEINYSFYREPKAGSWDNWRETAPEGFRFAVKAHRYVTHRKRLADTGDSLQRVIKGARRLGPRLGPVLYQLPPYFRRTDGHSERLERFLGALPQDMMHAFEFRDTSWFVEGTYDQLRRHDAALCSFHRGETEAPLLATARFAYMRFHGTDARYGGNYLDGMLQGWAERLRELGRQVEEVWVYFNNDVNAYAVDNATTLMQMLRPAARVGAVP